MASAISLGRAVVQVYGDWSRFNNAATAAVGGFLGNAGYIARNLTYAVSLPIGLAMGGALREFTAFEKAIAEAAAVTLPEIALNTEFASSELKKLEDAARKAGRETVFSATEAAGALVLLGRTGLDATEAAEALRPALDLAAAANIDVAKAADISTNVMKAFGLEVSDLVDIADILALGAARTNTSVEQLGQAFSYVGPIAAQAGLDVAETTAYIGQLSDRGIQASKAGTSLRNAMFRMIAPTKAAQKLMDNLGITTVDAEGNFVGMVSALEQFRDAGLTTTEILQLFKQRAGSGFAVLLESLEDSQELTGDLRAEMNNMTGAAGNMAAFMIDNLAGSIELAKDAAIELALRIGESGLGSAVRELVDGARAVILWMTQLDDNTLTLITSIATFVAGLWPAIWALTSLFNGMLGIAAFIPTLITVIAPLGAAFLVVREFIDGFIDKWNELVEADPSRILLLQQAWYQVSESLRIVREGVQRLWDIFASADSVEEGLRAAWAGLTTHGNIIFDGLSQSFNTAWDYLTTWIREDGMDMISTALSAGGEALLTAGENMAEPIINGIIGFIENKADFVEAGAKLLSELVDSMATGEPPTSELGKLVTEKIVPALGEALSKAGPAIAESLGNALTYALSAAATAITGDTSVGDRIEESLGGGQFGQTLIETFNNIRDALSGAFDWIKESAAGLEPRVSGLIENFQKFWVAIQPIARFLWTVLAPVLKFVATLIATSIRSAIDAALSVIQYLLEALTGLANFLTGVFTLQFDQAWQGILDFFSGIIGAIIGAIRLFIEVGFLKIFSGGFKILRRIVTGGWSVLKQLFTAPLTFITNLVKKVTANILAIFTGNFTKIKGGVTSFAAGVRGTIRYMITAVRNFIKKGLSFISKLWRTILGGIRRTWEGIWLNISTYGRKIFNNIVKAVKAFLNGAWSTVRNRIADIKQAFRTGWNGIKDTVRLAIIRVKFLIKSGLTSMWNTARSLLTKITAPFKNLKTTILNMFNNAKTWLRDAGKKIIDGLLGGIEEKFGAIGKVVGTAVDKVKEFWPFSPAKTGPLRDDPPETWGANVMDLVAKGMYSNMGSISDAASEAAGLIGGQTSTTSRPFGGGGLMVQNLNVTAYGDDFNLQQVESALALRGLV
jgi:TP901 family phage tail tape measure protein